MQPPEIVEEELDCDRELVPVLDGVEMSVVDDGPDRTGETIVFQHGNPAWSFLWRHLIEDAVRAGHRVIAPDLVGLGMSEKPLSPSYHSLNRHITNLEDALDELDAEDVTLVLHDWGGPIGMGYATRNPDNVDRIVLANTIAFPPSKPRSLSLWHKAIASPIGGLLGSRTKLVPETAFRLGVRDELDDAVREAYLWPFQQKGARVAAQRLVEMVPDGPEHSSAETLASIQDDYDEIDADVLVLWADDDPVMRPSFAEKWLEPFPNAHVEHVSESAKHFWQEDELAPFSARILDFVAGKLT